MEMLKKEAPDFIPPTLWPPNSPDLNPVDYKIWSVMQEKVYKRRVKDTSELRERIVAAWNELDQHIIDTAVSHTLKYRRLRGDMTEVHKIIGPT